MKILSLQESLDLELGKANELYSRHFNPGLMNIYKALGMGSWDIVSAEGMEIRLRDGRTILDFSSSIGVLGLGHNHPRILAAERICHENKVIDAIKMAPHKLQGALAHNLAQMLPDPLEVSFFSVSGAEAVEAAMKLCEKAQSPEKTKFITMSGSFHGKTHGALSVTTAGGFQRGFLMGIPPENVIEVEYGSLDAVERAIAGETSGGANPIIALLVEPVTGEGVHTPPEGYLRGLAEICKKNGIYTIFDEVKVGMGRMGTFCAFQQEDVAPDVVTLSKALGGGKRAIGAMVSGREIYQKAYGSRKDCSLHTSTFTGLGESCAVAIEALNIYRDDNLIEKARENGEYLSRKLSLLKEKHKGKIVELRGRGLLQGVRFSFGKGLFDKVVDTSKMGLFKTSDSAFMASMLRALNEQHNILAHFAPSSPDLLHIMPPLIVETGHLDTYVDALDDILTKGFAVMAAQFVKANIRDRLTGA